MTGLRVGWLLVFPLVVTAADARAYMKHVGWNPVFSPKMESEPRRPRWRVLS